MAGPSLSGRVGSLINTKSGLKTPSLTRIYKKREIESKKRLNFVRRYFPDTVTSPCGTESLAGGIVRCTMGRKNKNDSAVDHTPPGLSDVRTTTYNLFEKTSMDTTDQVFQAWIRIRTKVKASLGDEPQ